MSYGNKGAVVLKVILYDRAKDLYQLDFLENADLSLTYIFPNPQLADDFRNRFNDLGLLGKRDVITISNFIKGELHDLEAFAKNYKGKAQLIPCLIPRWKNNIEKPSFEKFLHTFNLLTDLRSFTLDFNLVEEVLSEFDAELAKGLEVFWKTLEDDELIDEHKSYNLITEKYIQGVETDQKQNFVFSGFGHLSALQIEMIQSLGNCHDVYIPFPKNAFTKAHSTDWINWTDTELTLKEIAEEKRDIKGTYSFFPKNKMSEYLKNKLPDKTVDYYLMSKSVNLEDINEIPQAGINFKVQNDIFKIKLKKIVSQIKNSHKWPQTKEVLLEQVESLVAAESEKEFHKKDFRELKIFLLLRGVLDDYSIDLLTLFDLRVVEYLVDLLCPRTFSSPLLKEESGQVRGIDRLGFYNPDNFKVICVNSNYPSLKTSGSRYPEKVEEFLRALGPIQSNFMEYLQIKEHVLEILEDENSLFFLEEGLEESDLAWEEIFSEFKSKEIVSKVEEKSTPKVDYLLPSIKQEFFELPYVSASRLQSYLDCPRKYYFSYCQKIAPYIEPQKSFDPRTLGLLEHKVIERYFKENNTWDKEIHKKLVEDILDKHLIDKVMSPSLKKTAQVEIRDYSYHGISEIFKILKVYPDAKLEFEKELLGGDIRGSVDLYFEAGDYMGVLDFKRSKASIGSEKDLRSFSKVQLWFYLNHLDSKKECVLLGYLNLARTDDSVILLTEEFKAKLKDEGFCQGKGLKDFKMPAKELLEKYISFENESFKNLLAESHWQAKPRTANACDFCSVAAICPRRVL